MYFNQAILLAEDSANTQNAGGMGIIGILLYLVFFIGLMYFLLIRPQKKQTKKQQEVMNSVEPGDSIMTTSGFYGTILDVVDDTTVIVEFGNNKNCRIPMHKRAIAEVEKAGTAEVSDEESDK
ncbi:MAG: preprotein translocase subunit YajC [Eubacterium sp.]|nr:preprotein translocase subunit YajC [Eubacterium sp.]MBR6218256.1 preprotein translocase subunit YajC [Eubacterium sp.]HBE09985.1 preprotein translocase subunit YajC [Lachnospiraceae bacterium]